MERIIELLKKGPPIRHSKAADVEMSEITDHYRGMFPGGVACSWCSRHQIYRKLSKHYGLA